MSRLRHTDPLKPCRRRKPRFRPSNSITIRPRRAIEVTTHHPHRASESIERQDASERRFPQRRGAPRHIILFRKTRIIIPRIEKLPRARVRGSEVTLIQP